MGTYVIEDVYAVPEEDDYESTIWDRSNEQANETAHVDTLDEIIEGVYVSASTFELVVAALVPEPEFATWDASSSQELRLPEAKIKPGQEWFWTDEWQAAEKAVEEDLASGNLETFDTMEDFLADLE